MRACVGERRSKEVLDSHAANVKLFVEELHGLPVALKLAGKLLKAEKRVTLAEFRSEWKKASPVTVSNFGRD